MSESKKVNELVGADEWEESGGILERKKSPTWPYSSDDEFMKVAGSPADGQWATLLDEEGYDINGYNNAGVDRAGKTPDENFVEEIGSMTLDQVKRRIRMYLLHAYTVELFLWMPGAGIGVSDLRRISGAFEFIAKIERIRGIDAAQVDSEVWSACHYEVNLFRGGRWDTLYEQGYLTEEEFKEYKLYHLSTAGKGDEAVSLGVCTQKDVYEGTGRLDRNAEDSELNEEDFLAELERCMRTTDEATSTGFLA